MAEHSNIAWTDATFNIAWGCTKISPGCAHCYAATLAARYGYDIWGPNSGRRVFGEKHWREPMAWNKRAQDEGKRKRVFCSSMCDVFEDHPLIIAELEKLWPLIRSTPCLDWQILTKRAERIRESLPLDWGNGYPNVWLGVSAEDQEHLNLRMPALLNTPAAVRFISVEPMLGPIVFDYGLEGSYTADWTSKFGIAGIDWVIFGGESGPRYRDCDPAWINSGVNQCKAGTVACFVKQDSGPKPGQQGRLSAEIFNTKEFPNL